MNESNIFGVSVRALIVFMLTVTVCGLTIFMVIKFQVIDKLPEPLYSAFMLALGFFFGQKNQGGSNVKENSTKPDISGGAPANIG